LAWSNTHQFLVRLHQRSGLIRRHCFHCHLIPPLIDF
jgi:hypothetical protein